MGVEWFWVVESGVVCKEGCKGDEVVGKVREKVGEGLMGGVFGKV